MILGRSTPQWLSLLSSAAGLATVLLVNVAHMDAVLVATVLGSLTTFLGGFLAFLANTATTPVKDPILPTGTEVTVQGTEDKVIIAATPPGPAGVNAGP